MDIGHPKWMGVAMGSKFAPKSGRDKMQPTPLKTQNPDICVHAYNAIKNSFSDFSRKNGAQGRHQSKHFCHCYNLLIFNAGKPNVSKNTIRNVAANKPALAR